MSEKRPRDRVRVSVKAIIIRDGRVLLVKSCDQDGDWYLLPGGGQQHGESLPAALRRECREEIGVEVEVGALRLVRDYIGKNHQFAAGDGDLHQIELMFECTIRGSAEPRPGPVPDEQQTGIAWLEIAELAGHRVYPGALAEHLGACGDRGEVVYLGDVN
jgi:8-oxo-dGTP pyrophosphatase MutT (NUDIX family)